MATNVLPIGGTEQSELVSVVVNGVTLGTFDTWTGGDAAAPATQYRSGGQKNMTSYRTLPKYTPLTVSRVNHLTRDWELIRSLIPLAGQVQASVTIQPLDATMNAYGNARVATGMFLGIKGLKGASDSETIQTYDIDISVDSWA